MEAVFQLINATLFAITVAITPAKQSGAGGDAQSGIQAEQRVAASTPVAVESGNVEATKEDARQATRP